MFVDKSQPIKIDRECLAAARAPDDGGGDDGASWRWRVYLKSVRKLVVTLSPSSSTLAASLLGPLLGKLDIIVVESTHGVQDGVGWEDGWEAWLINRWSTGNAPNSLKLDEVPLRLAQNLANQRAVRNLWVVATEEDSGDYLRQLVQSIKHGLDRIQIGSGVEMPKSAGKQYPCEIPGELAAYAEKYRATLLGVDLMIVQMRHSIPGVPVVALEVRRTVLPNETNILAHKETLRYLNLRSRMTFVPDGILPELRKLEFLNLGKLRSIEPFIAALPRMASLRHLSFAMGCPPRRQDLFAGLMQLHALETLCINVSSRDVINFYALNEVPSLRSLCLINTLNAAGEGAITLRTTLKYLKVVNVRVVVDMAMLSSVGAHNLEYLIVHSDRLPRLVNLDGLDCEAEFTQLIADRAIASRLQHLQITGISQFQPLSYYFA
ncbi:hypothetical protein HK101_002064 [Irineochytrium annulatum]|nr:hypothetical protein HK101_002064 [Irineochytrium annulatum]